MLKKISLIHEQHKGEKMITLEELQEYKKTMTKLADVPTEGITEDVVAACNVAASMFDAIIVQLENQAVSFTP